MFTIQNRETSFFIVLAVEFSSGQNAVLNSLFILNAELYRF